MAKKRVSSKGRQARRAKPAPGGVEAVKDVLDGGEAVKPPSKGQAVAGDKRSRNSSGDGGGNDGSAQGPDTQSWYQLREDGLWFAPPDEVLEAASPSDRRQLEPIRLCGRLHVEGETFNPESTEHGLLLAWDDFRGVRREWVLRRGDLATPQQVQRRLMNGGLQVETKRRALELLVLYLARLRSLTVITTVSRTGWYEIGSGRRVFVLPDRVIGDAGKERVLLDATGSVIPEFACKGDLAQWQSEIAAPAIGNSRLVLAISMAFAAPLLTLLGDESGGVHFRGGSSLGKTTALRVAASVGGVKQYAWRATGNGLEGVASLHNDALLCVDEIGQANPKEVGEVAYLLANGAGKSRAQQDGTARPPATWRLLFLSSGEMALGDLMLKAGGHAQAGQEVRVLDLPADAGAGHGLFERLPDGFGNAGAFAEHLRLATEQQRGSAARAFLGHLLKQGDFRALVGEIETARRRWLEAHVPIGADGQVIRGARRFALMAVAGGLATRFGIVPWSENEAEWAANICFGDWLTQRGGLGPAEVKAAENRLRNLIARHGASRFQDLSEPRLNGEAQESNWRVVDRAGYRRSTAGSFEYLIFPSVWKSEVIEGLDMPFINRAFVENGILISGSDDKPQCVVKIEGASRRLYCIRADRLGDAED